MLCNTCILRCHHSSFSFSFFSSYLFFLRSLPSFLMTVQRIEACQRALLYTHLVFLNCCCYYCLSLSLLLVECCAKHADHARSFISGITCFSLASDRHETHYKSWQPKYICQLSADTSFIAWHVQNDLLFLSPFSGFYFNFSSVQKLLDSETHIRHCLMAKRKPPGEGRIRDMFMYEHHSLYLLESGA